MEVSNYLKKFKLLVKYIFEGKVVLNENTTEKLLNFLDDRSDNSEYIMFDLLCSYVIYLGMYFSKRHGITSSYNLVIFLIISIIYISIY